MRIGDKVIVLNLELCDRAGEVGEIVLVSKDGRLILEFQDGQWEEFHPQQVELLNPPELPWGLAEQAVARTPVQSKYPEDYY